ncbi:OmpA family protein [Vibrio sp. YMD68]|uniref:OmpA family protein n=1 Tax=Vibrio sp. YMD68 TaxID=3042300 RepID=UPI00249BC506|nr:OmpA family protein [Vibrio sp. YMD68]WGV99127.1 OmpA family protein [Vibrio sp. YMD68]
MNKHLIPLLVTASFFSSHTLAEEEYSYIATPVATQLDDLLDDDRDGVINARDLCVETPLASEIDNDGCETYIDSKQEMKLNILFANDSYELNSVFLNQIRVMTEFMTNYPSTSIELQGYASKVGNPEYNLKLSEKRAETIRKELISNGLSHTRIDIVGHGASSLAAYGDDEQSHALNRKVEATVVGFKGSVKEAWTIFDKIEK